MLQIILESNESEHIKRLTLILPYKNEGGILLFIWHANEGEINVIPEQISVFYSRLDSFLSNRCAVPMHIHLRLYSFLYVQ
jgi:hypothetical protein